jgi:ferredoxin-thioredoxin reductase catalytic subunit
MSMSDITEEHVDLFYRKLKQGVESSGYHLNLDEEFTKELLKSILINQNRYGYGSCPCRLASGVKEEDIDIICPCDYRDPDLDDYGACYCGLYVSGKILSGERQLTPIPERRPGPDDRKQPNKVKGDLSATLSLPVWRCKVCGYLCGREDPPETCPICMAGKERFERFM